MHEVGLMQEALDLAIAEAERQGARHIHQITLRVGRLAGVEPEALAFAFEVVTAGTMAEGARLEVETVPVVCRCPDCRDEFRPADFVFACPRCGGLSLDLRHGDELELATLEVS